VHVIAHGGMSYALMFASQSRAFVAAFAVALHNVCIFFIFHLIHTASITAGDGAAAVVLVEHGVQKAKELQVIAQLPWLHMCVNSPHSCSGLGLRARAGTCCTGTMKQH
jgi:hypothetical protein